MTSLVILSLQRYGLVFPGFVEKINKNRLKQLKLVYEKSNFTVNLLLSVK